MRFPCSADKLHNIPRTHTDKLQSFDAWMVYLNKSLYFYSGTRKTALSPCGGTQRPLSSFCIRWSRISSRGPRTASACKANRCRHHKQDEGRTCPDRRKQCVSSPMRCEWLNVSCYTRRLSAMWLPGVFLRFIKLMTIWILKFYLDTVCTNLILSSSDPNDIMLF